MPQRLLVLSISCFCTDKKESLICLLAFAPALEGHFRIARSVRLSVPWRSCLGYRQAGCLQLSHRQPPQMCGLWSGCGVFAITQVVYFSSTWMLVRGPGVPSHAAGCMQTTVLFVCIFLELFNKLSEFKVLVIFRQMFPDVMF